MRLKPIDRYRIFGLRRVEGWLIEYSADFIVMLSSVQHRLGASGAVAEIGVHHGKLFLVILLSAAPDEKALAIDVFDQHHLNVDQSGRGDQAAFLANISKWAGPRDVNIIARSSLEVRPKEIVDKVGFLRLASIDGGHTEECTLNDLRLIEACLAPKGIAIIDDYFNPMWPDVSSGVAKYLTDPTSKLRPFAISPNKVYLTAPQNIAAFRAAIAAHSEFKLNKTSWMFGSEVDIYGSEQKSNSTVVFFLEALKRSRVGPYLLAFKSRLK